VRQFPPRLFCFCVCHRGVTWQMVPSDSQGGLYTPLLEPMVGCRWATSRRLKHGFDPLPAAGRTHPLKRQARAVWASASSNRIKSSAARMVPIERLDLRGQSIQTGISFAQRRIEPNLSQLEGLWDDIEEW